MPALNQREIDALNTHARAAGFEEESPLWWAAHTAIRDHLAENPEDLDGAYKAAQEAADTRQADLDLFTPETFIEPGYVAVTWAKFGGFELVESYGDSIGTGLRVCIERADFERFSMLPAAELDGVIESLEKIRRARDLVKTQGFETKDLKGIRCDR